VGRDLLKVIVKFSNELLSSDLVCRNVDPPIWYDTDVKLFEIQRI
jgi:hypothetical protein